MIYLIKKVQAKAATLSSTLIILCYFSHTATAQISFEDGRKWYKQRAIQADSSQANPEAINNAIQAFEKSLEVSYRIEETTIFLLQSYYFKGMHTTLSDAKRKATFDKARLLGEKMTEQFPKSAAIAYWYGLNLREWDKMHNFLQTTVDRTDKKLRDLARSVVTLDSTYQGGGGFRLLAKIHFETPRIWLIKNWPSNDKALAFIRKAIKIAPEMPENRLFYARMLIHFGRNSEAKTQLERIINMSPRSNYLIEDRSTQYRAKQLWQKYLITEEEANLTKVKSKWINQTSTTPVYPASKKFYLRSG